MLDVTQAACSRLSEMLADYPSDVAVRVFIRDSRRKTRPDTRQPGDGVIEHAGRAVLLLDENASRHLGNRILDVRETEAGPKLKFRLKVT